MLNKCCKIIFNDLAELKYNSAYFYTKVISDSVKSHRDRGFIKIKNPMSKAFIIRKVRDKSYDRLEKFNTMSHNSVNFSSFEFSLVL